MIDSLRRGHRGRAGLVAILSVACFVVVMSDPSAAAVHRVSYGPPPGGPDLAVMALGVQDFPAGARVLRERYVKPGIGDVAEYDREFAELSVRVGSRRLLGFENDVWLGKSIDDADTSIFGFRIGLALAADQIGAEFAKGSGLKPTYTKVGKPAKFGTGDNSVCVVIRVGTRIGEIRVVVAIVRVGRIDSAFFFAGLPKSRLGMAEAKQLARIAVRHIRQGLTPANTSPPTISGTPQVGQTLTADPGLWSNAPTSFAYQWERCDATGAACVGIAGASGQTYVPVTEDAGTTIVVAVMASSTYGFGTATSVATAVVAPAVPPPPPPPAG